MILAKNYEEYRGLGQAKTTLNRGTAGLTLGRRLKASTVPKKPPVLLKLFTY